MLWSAGRYPHSARVSGLTLPPPLSSVIGGFWLKNIIFPPSKKKNLMIAPHRSEAPLGCRVSHPLHPSPLQTRVSCSGSPSWLCCLSVTADLCAEPPVGINQAYQRDSCLFTCYKHLPAPRSCSISVQIIYRRPASAPRPCLLSGCSSNISAGLPRLAS